MHTKELGKKIDIEISKYHLNKKQEKEVFEQNEKCNPLLK